MVCVWWNIAKIGCGFWRPRLAGRSGCPLPVPIGGSPAATDGLSDVGRINKHGSAGGSDARPPKPGFNASDWAGHVRALTHCNMSQDVFDYVFRLQKIKQSITGNAVQL